MNKKNREIVGIWLVIGLVMVMVQVVLGGITRLTDSGLSITELKLIKGILPPMNPETWNIAFEKYQLMAKQQYENLHFEMTLTKFKNIYFWEWFHRLWGRMMGLVFLFPFIYFLAKKQIPKWLLKRLAVVILLASIVATFGWLMVLSGFENENRTWVSAYRLSLHLGVAAILFLYLFNTAILVLQKNTYDSKFIKFKKFAFLIVVLIFTQILLGGLMAGMRAGIVHAHWPFFRGNNSLLNILSSNTNFSFESIINYESNNYIKAIVQVFHRSFAWLILFFSVIFSYKLKKENISNILNNGISLMLFIIAIQFSLGVFTILNVNNDLLLPLGVLHQAFAFISLISWLFIYYQLKINKR